ncbi:MAG TPA: PEP-CTERM sorting domain-containing protein [Gemmatales bacterium]|nr:PEP-CTERM sorting domain-containing protein [Gemmatales bacterium]HMP16123.1 PEP-CTERM sorting domain-containing protein [Gemmatales bacterium]
MRFLFYSAAVLAALVFAVPGNLLAQSPFNFGNIAVYSKGSGATSLGNTATQINILELSSTVLNQAAPVQTIDVSTPLNLWTSGTATSTGYLKLSPNGSLTFTGHVGQGTGNINANINRAAAAISIADGVPTIGTTYTGQTGNQTRAAVTHNGIDYYVADQGGIYQNGGATAALAGNFRGLQIINNQTYIGQQSGNTSNIQVSSVNPPLPSAGAPTITGLPGLTNSNTVNDFILLSSTGEGGPVDLLYTSTSTGINKFSFDGTDWIARGSATVTGGVFGITASINPAGGFNIFYTTGTGSTAANRLEFQTDSALFDSNISLGGANILYTAPANTTLAGVALAVPEPTTYALIGVNLLGAGAVEWRRRRKLARA